MPWNIATYTRTRRRAVGILRELSSDEVAGHDVMEDRPSRDWKRLRACLAAVGNVGQLCENRDKRWCDQL